jgi:thiosulfate/3-mercaptopyruvate sulfurtransferase
VTQRRPFRRINIEEAEALLRRDDVLLVDVRDAKSFGKAHIKGAEHVSITNLSTVVEGTAKSRAILVYCYHGHASREYAQVFSDFGFAEVYSLDGGYEGWQKRPHELAAS